MKILFIFLVASIFSANSYAQIDTAFMLQLKALDTANFLKTDTLAVPEDALTKKIRLLRSQRHGLTTETAIRMKIMEEQAKDTVHSKEFYNKLLAEFTTGHTAKLIDNSLINLYRRTFTRSEIDQLIAFYKTPAGKKMDKQFILLMLQSIKGAEHLLKIAINNLSATQR